MQKKKKMGEEKKIKSFAKGLYNALFVKVEDEVEKSWMEKSIIWIVRYIYFVMASNYDGVFRGTHGDVKWQMTRYWTKSM